MPPARAADQIPLVPAGNAFASCTGRAVSARRGRPVPAAMILIVGPGGWPSAGRAIAAVTGRGLRVLISSELDDFLRYSLIKAAILPVRMDPETVATLQAEVESDPGILLTVDFGRREVRARGSPASAATASRRRPAPPARAGGPRLRRERGRMRSDLKVMSYLWTS